MSILSGTAGGGIGVRESRPRSSRYSAVHCAFLYQRLAAGRPSPHSGREIFSAPPAGQCRAAGLEPLEQAYGGDVIRIFGFRAANAQPVFRVIR